MMEPSFEKLLVLLADAGVDFLVVGGIAVSIQGYDSDRGRSGAMPDRYFHPDER